MFTATPQTVRPGEMVHLTWGTSGAAQVTINGTPVGPTGQDSVPVTQDSRFVLAIRGADGSSEQRTVQVVIDRRSGSTRAAGVPSIDSFEFTPPVVAPGQTTVLRWSVSGAETVVISPNIGHVAARGQIPIRPRDTQQYTLRAGGETAQATIAVQADTESAADAPQRDTRGDRVRSSNVTSNRVFHVTHDHAAGAGGLMKGITGRLGRNVQVESCAGTLSLREGVLSFTSSGGHSFTSKISEVREIQKNRLAIGGQPAFHVRLANGENYNFTLRGGGEVDETVVFLMQARNER
jgi:hypothetical protein